MAPLWGMAPCLPPGYALGYTTLDLDATRKSTSAVGGQCKKLHTVLVKIRKCHRVSPLQCNECPCSREQIVQNYPPYITDQLQHVLTY